MSYRMVLALLLLLPASVLAQTGSPTGVTKDPQAMSVVRQVLAAYGGEASVGALTDYRATGQITYNWGTKPVVGSATILSRGLDQFRLDVVLPTGTRRWAVTHNSAVLEAEDGQKTPIPFHNAAKFGALTFPVRKLAAAAADDSVSIRYAGMVNAGSAYDIRVEPAQSAAPDTDSTKRFIEYIIDSKTLLIIAVMDKVYSNDDMGQAFDHMMWFSDFRSVNGINVPFSVTELVDRAKGWTLIISSISFNAGLTDADFTF